MFELSLERPTENSLAQAGWASREHEGVSERPRLGHRNDVHEARAWESFVAGDFEKTLRHAESWFLDQPFSARPAQLISWIDSALLDDHKHAIELLSESLRANPSDAIILNNTAFACENIGRLAEARKRTDRAGRATKTGDETLFVKATCGLIAFRQHNAILGRKLYLEVIDAARSGPSIGDRIEPMAWAYLAREECLAIPTTRSKRRHRHSTLHGRRSGPMLRVCYDTSNQSLTSFGVAASQRCTPRDPKQFSSSRNSA
jgi:tetratricopeptide (TPR) repeat protein